MSKSLMFAAGLLLALAMASPASAAVPGSLGQSHRLMQTDQATTLVEAIHWRRYHHRHLRFYFGRQRYYNEHRIVRGPYFYKRYRRHHHEHRYSPNTYYPKRNTEFQPEFDFSIRF